MQLGLIGSAHHTTFAIMDSIKTSTPGLYHCTRNTLSSSDLGPVIAGNSLGKIMCKKAAVYTACICYVQMASNTLAIRQIVVLMCYIRCCNIISIYLTTMFVWCICECVNIYFFCSFKVKMTKGSKLPTYHC